MTLIEYQYTMRNGKIGKNKMWTNNLVGWLQKYLPEFGAITILSVSKG